MSHKTAATVAHTIGIDTGKNTLHLIGLDDKGAIVLQEKVARDRITVRLANVSQCLIGIEAGMAMHYVARRQKIDFREIFGGVRFSTACCGDCMFLR